MDAAKIKSLRDFYKESLLNETIPFWLKHTIDHEYGGFLNYLDADGSVLNYDKPVWPLCRFTWLMSLLYNNVEKRQEWLDTARHGIEFIEKHCFDTDGRMFYEVTRDGRPLRKRRYVFSETFGVMAFSEYALASGDTSKLSIAKQLYQLVLRHYNDPSLLLPKVFPQTRVSKSHAMPMIILCISQQMRKIEKDPLYDKIIDKCLNEVFEDFMHYDEKALLENVGPNGERLDSPEGRCVNPGHSIESAAFIMTESHYRNAPDMLTKACDILDWSLALGWDDKYEGILYFVDIENKPPDQYEHDMKLWWPHNEALYATLLAYHLTNKEKYAQWYEKIHKYVFSHFPDKKHGEWFKYLHRDGSISSAVKGNRWAGPFHLPRMQYNCWQLLRAMLEKQ